MGLILDTKSPILGVEIRRESVGLLDLQRKPYGPGDTRPERAHLPGISAHVFVYEDGAIEVSKEWLRALLEFFAKPENAEHL